MTMLPLFDWPEMRAAEDAVHLAHEEFSEAREAWIRAPYGQRRKRHRELERANLKVLRAELLLTNIVREMSR